MTTVMAPARTRDAYVAAFAAERQRTYPVIDDLEARLGYAVDRERLESAARVLACPVKVHPPCWQHGRVLYAVARAYLAVAASPVTMLDIGTAKGFSALCLQWALTDAGREGQVYSVDVLDPHARVKRNTVAEVDGLQTLAETLAPWPEAHAITFMRSTGIDWLTQASAPIDLVFVDGKHSGAVVHAELARIAARQGPGAMVILDDLQIAGVDLAVRQTTGYRFERVAASPDRIYAIGTRMAKGRV